MENNDTKHPEYTKTPVGEKRSVRPRRTQSEEAQHSPTESEVYSGCEFHVQ